MSSAAAAGGQRVRHRTVVVGFVTAILGSILALIGPQSAFAHAQLLASDPAEGAVLEQAPTTASLSFNEPVQLVSSGIQLFSSSGSPTALDASIVDNDVVITLPTDLADGRYALSYRVVSSDGHPISGAVSFAIGDASVPAFVPQIDMGTPVSTTIAVNVLTALQYIGLLVFAGLVFFRRVILRDSPVSPPQISTAQAVGGITAVGVSLLLVPVLALNVSGAGLSQLVDVEAWRAGVLSPPVASAIAVVAGVSVTVWMSGAGHVSDRAQMPWSVVVALLATGVAVCAPALVGHTRLIEPRIIMMGADVGHLLAGAFWLGGVLGLVLVLAHSPLSPDTEAEDDVVIVQRFSHWALWSVVLLALSGVTMSALILDAPSALWSTMYGRLLLTKVAALTPIIGIAAYNRWKLLPAIKKLAEPQTKYRALHRLLRVEAALLIVVLGITGFLTNQSPERDLATRPSTSASAPEGEIQAQLQGLRVSGDLTPGEVGENEFTFTLRYEGVPVAPEDVVVRTILPSRDLGPFEVIPTLDPDTGEYTAVLSLPFADEWRVQVIARIDTFTQPIVTMPVTVR